MERELTLRLGEAGDRTRMGAAVSSGIVRSGVTGCQLLVAPGSSWIGVGMKGGKVSSSSSLTILGWLSSFSTFSSLLDLFTGLSALLAL